MGEKGLDEMLQIAQQSAGAADRDCLDAHLTELSFLFSLHCFPFRLDQKTIVFVLQPLHLAESMCHRTRMKLSFTVEERKPN